MELSHGAAREEYEQVDREIADHQESHGGAGQNTGAKRHGAHRFRKRRLINLVVFG
jgi:hypothetical protein